MALEIIVDEIISDGGLLVTSAAAADGLSATAETSANWRQWLPPGGAGPPLSIRAMRMGGALLIKEIIDTCTAAVFA